MQFNGTNGASPIAPLTARSDGFFYGVTGLGGSADRGTVFRLSPDGNLLTLASFGGAEGAPAAPFSAFVFGPDGNLYGATAGGGRGGGGTVFRLTLPKILSLTPLAGSTLRLTGKGAPNGSYRLLGVADLSQPVTSWTSVTSGVFDSSGSFSFADVSTNQARFYRLSVP